MRVKCITKVSARAPGAVTEVLDLRYIKCSGAGKQCVNQFS